MADVMIKAENVGKKFSKSLNRMMLYGILDITKNILGCEADTEKLRKDEFWAVNNLNFELKRGESLGIIGPNGSGKTTLLKMLNGIFMPDTGNIRINGRVSALIQVGAGFHPMLTGRENIYLNGSILGMRKKEIDRKFDSIVDFADIGDFLDTPVRHYSSGMFVRLGFSVAIHCDPDILLVDEVLAVGDLRFRRKCAKRMKELEAKDVTILFVTHDMGILRHICDRAICLRSGSVVHYGDLDGAISEYMAAPVDVNGEQREKSSCNIIQGVTARDEKGEEIDTFLTGGAYTFEVRLNSRETIDTPAIGFGLYDSSGVLIIGTNSRKVDFKIEDIHGEAAVYIKFPFLNLIPGNYGVKVGLFDNSMGEIDSFSSPVRYRVNSKKYSTGAIFSQHYWSIKYGPG